MNILIVFQSVYQTRQLRAIGYKELVKLENLFNYCIKFKSFV